MHPLTLLTVGVYGSAAAAKRRAGPPDRAVEVRFKGIKSIVVSS